MTQDEKHSSAEELKAASRFLRGDIAAELATDAEGFSADSAALLKHHGTYQQDNRDDRSAARAAGQAGKRMMLMVRSRIPGGLMTAAQLLAEIDLGDRFGNGTIRLTSRQSIQLHGVLKANLREVIRRINEVQLSTLAACGDVTRNVMCCPSPHDSPWHHQMQQMARDLALHFAPRTGAYREIWLLDPETGEKQQVAGGDEAETEPIYGRTYLPRKFKMGIALPEDNCIDVYTHDLGLLAIVEESRVVGYNVLVGGGQGVTPSNKKTYPALAKPLAYVPVESVLAVAEAVVKVQRDHGNREDRKLARMKYLVDKWGIDAFRAKVEEYCGQRLERPRDVHVQAASDHMGWEAQGDGRWCYGLNVENGRVADTARMRLKSALRQICAELSPGIRLTAHQSLLLTGLQEQDRSRLAAILRDHGVPLTEEISTVRRWSMACVAWPTCGLAITESERALPGIIDLMESEIARLGLAQEAFTVRMTGCPNGCARPYNSDIGLVGKARGRYTLFLGGSRLGYRLNFLYQDLVPAEEVVARLVPLFAYFAQDRTAGESFGDFCHRKGCADLQAWADAHASDARR
jgi:sulfite reductase (ferredoxin)